MCGFGLFSEFSPGMWLALFYLHASTRPVFRVICPFCQQKVVLIWLSRAWVLATISSLHIISSILFFPLQSEFKYIQVVLQIFLLACLLSPSFIFLTVSSLWQQPKYFCVICPNRKITNHCVHRTLVEWMTPCPITLD